MARTTHDRVKPPPKTSRLQFSNVEKTIIIELCYAYEVFSMVARSV